MATASSGSHRDFVCEKETVSSSTLAADEISFGRCLSEICVCLTYRFCFSWMSFAAMPLAFSLPSLMNFWTWTWILTLIETWKETLSSLPSSKSHVDRGGDPSCHGVPSTSSLCFRLSSSSKLPPLEHFALPALPLPCLPCLPPSAEPTPRLSRPPPALHLPPRGKPGSPQACWLRSSGLLRPPLPLLLLQHALQQLHSIPPWQQPQPVQLYATLLQRARLPPLRMLWPPLQPEPPGA
mmetsp:Transcript_64992/g.136164  ORF Transcript_64992/g.136164 Transcript_64992/m.136164 type:complete len:238 (+) Transcript_64992:516-1229(+)